MNWNEYYLVSVRILNRIMNPFINISTIDDIWIELTHITSINILLIQMLEFDRNLYLIMDFAFHTWYFI